MNAMDFDALMVQPQGFNTLDNLAASAASQQLTQQALANIQAMQSMPTAHGYVPDNAVLPVFQRQAEEAQRMGASTIPTFFVSLGGEQKGPLSLEQLKGLAIADVIDEETLVWRQGTPEWTSLKTCLSTLNQ